MGRLLEFARRNRSRLLAITFWIAAIVAWNVWSTRQGDEKVIVHAGGRLPVDAILVAAIVGPHAGDLISELSLAITNKIGLLGVAATIHPYPTLAEAIRRDADAYNRTRLTPLSNRWPRAGWPGNAAEEVL